MKRLLIVLLFLLIPFSLPVSVFAQTPSTTPTQTQNNGGILDWLSSFFSGISNYFSKDYDINPDTVYDKTALSNYNQKDKDVTSRAISDKDRTLNKDDYINAVVAGKYDNKVLGTCAGNQIKISNLNNYPKTDKCIATLYEGLQIVPQGNAGGQENAAAVSSKQLNNSLRTPIPQNSQVEPEANLWDDFLSSVGLIDKTAKENKKQEKAMLKNLIPAKSQTDDSADNENLKNNFSDYMYPQDWQDNPPDSPNSPDTPNTGNTPNNNDPNNSNNISNPTYTGKLGQVISTHTGIDGLTVYVFEKTGGGRLKQRYDANTVGVPIKKMPSQYTLGGRNTTVDERIIPAYTAMIEAGRKAGLSSRELLLISGYRDNAAQQVLYNQWLARVGPALVSKYAARPGSSPHHTGRAIDVQVTGGKSSRTYKWLLENGNKYGFYNYAVEAWHWEYNPS
ncbi:MAG: M15 family metallopeptidase [Candidatus Shapirobacteria bacterium]